MSDKGELQQRILVVDDEVAIAVLLQSMLRRSGYSVAVACDGQQAWELFHELPFDLVISDLKMPRLDGEQLVQRIKAQAPETLIVILTGHGTPEDTERLLAIGATQVLQKPLHDIKDMVVLIEQLLER